MSRHQQRSNWGTLRVVLVTAALAILAATNLPIPGLRGHAPYAWIAAGAVCVGFVGFIFLIRTRPTRWPQYEAPSRGWASILPRLVLLLGLAIGVWRSWLVFLAVPTSSVPQFALMYFLASIVVHYTLWWWLRRQTGKDRRAWIAALIIQVLGTALMVAIALTLMFIDLRLIPLAHLACLFIGVSVATRSLRGATDAHPIVEDASPYRNH